MTIKFHEVTYENFYEDANYSSTVTNVSELYATIAEPAKKLETIKEETVNEIKSKTEFKTVFGRKLMENSYFLVFADPEDSLYVEEKDYRN